MAAAQTPSDLAPHGGQETRNPSSRSSSAPAAVGEDGHASESFSHRRNLLASPFLLGLTVWSFAQPGGRAGRLEFPTAVVIDAIHHRG